MFKLFAFKSISFTQNACHAFSHSHGFKNFFQQLPHCCFWEVCSQAATTKSLYHSLGTTTTWIFKWRQIYFHHCQFWWIAISSPWSSLANGCVIPGKAFPICSCPKLGMPREFGNRAIFHAKFFPPWLSLVISLLMAVQWVWILN